MVGAGTVWLWAAPEAFEEVDVLFVDEAAQMSLANVLAVSQAAKTVPGARVGTVDKFQGQEAPIAIYSTATSSRADAPRGMGFLYSLNCLNVAISRAKCTCIMVCSPDLFEVDWRTPRQMQLANAFCRFLELAQPVPQLQNKERSDLTQVFGNAPYNIVGRFSGG